VKTRPGVQVGTRQPEPSLEGSHLRPHLADSARERNPGACRQSRFRAPCTASGSAVVNDPDTVGVEEWGVLVKAPAADLSEVGYSIQVPRPQCQLVCPRCDILFLAAGPTGHEAGKPICDLCLLEGAHELGVLLALASTARVFGAFETEDAVEYEQVLGEYGNFARIYECIAARSGPPRLFPSAVLEAGS
jgi:hypothetical protein